MAICGVCGKSVLGITIVDGRCYDCRVRASLDQQYRPSSPQGVDAMIEPVVEAGAPVARPAYVVVARQRLNAIGWWGAILFVGSPSLAAVLLLSSTAAYFRVLSTGYSYAAGSELYHPVLYLVLMALGLIGLVMILVGRDTVAPSPINPTADGT